MVGIYMVRKRNRESDHDVLTSMHVRHNPDHGTLEHRVIKEMIHHREGFLLYIIREDFAVLAILSF